MREYIEKLCCSITDGKDIPLDRELTPWERLTRSHTTPLGFAHSSIVPATPSTKPRRTENVI